MTTIQEQIALTDEVLGKLEGISRDVYVAGGAPRDWLYNRVANDIDIWISPNYRPGHGDFILDVQRLVTPNGLSDVTPDVENYHGFLNPMLSQVLEFHVGEQKFNLMRLRWGMRPEDLVERFPLSIAQAWYRRHSYPESSEWFKLGQKTGIIFEQTHVGYGHHGKWVEKVKGYYPDHKVMYR